MSESLFDIVFRGDIVLGHRIGEVKQRLAQLFKANESRINDLFSGAAVPLKRNLDKATAEKYRAVLMKAGAQVDVMPAGKVAIRPVKPRRPAPRRGKIPLAERLAMEAEAKTAGKAVVEQDEEGWSLAPVGADILKSVDKQKRQVPVAEVDTSGLSLRPTGGDLLDAGERSEVVEVEADFSDFDLAEPGADLLTVDEKLALPEVEFELPDLDLAEVGADLLTADEKPAAPAVAPNISDFELAPTGAVLGRKRQPAPPPAPDTSGLTLAD